MKSNKSLKDVLESFRSGGISLDEAEVQISGLRVENIGDFARIDLGRNMRCGMPEVILAEGKETGHLIEILMHITKSGERCLATRVSEEQSAAIIESCEKSGISVDYNPVARTVVLSDGMPPGKTGGVVAVITAGTSDARVAEEAKVIAEEMGCTVKTAYDVGAAGIHRLFPAMKEISDASAYVVCAGREGTLPTVIAGLVDKPVIGVPVSVGYGYMGKGEAALASMLQSCAVITVVNIDSGFTAGAFAARIANMVKNK
ncbi:MAG: nickel pincer cofactor biosynthesis protein LarB [Methanomicrobiaceae archaeon]|nr:nickel pincer cofactor biosynthesis protein LarB [Methanomicrobiaceae archaeon]